MVFVYKKEPFTIWQLPYVSEIPKNWYIITNRIQKVQKDITAKNEYNQLKLNVEKLLQLLIIILSWKEKKWGEEPKDDMIESVEDDP